MLQSQKYPNNSRTISGAINIVRTDDVTLLCNTSSGIVGMSLQEIPNDYYSTQYKLYVVDLSANASTNNITIDAPSGHTINGASSFVINANSASVVISIVANKTYICQYSVIGGGGIAQAYQTIQEEGSALTQRSNMNFIGTSVNAVDDSGNSRTNVTIQAYNTIQEEGTPLTQRDKINFIGSGVSAADNAGTGATDVTILGAGQWANIPYDDGDTTNSPSANGRYQSSGGGGTGAGASFEDWYAYKGIQANWSLSTPSARRLKYRINGDNSCQIMGQIIREIVPIANIIDLNNPAYLYNQSIIPGGGGTATFDADVLMHYPINIPALTSGTPLIQFLPCTLYVFEQNTLNLTNFASEIKFASIPCTAMLYQPSVGVGNLQFYVTGGQLATLNGSISPPISNIVTTSATTYNVTFSYAHNLGSGIPITISNVLGTTNANGTYTFTSGVPTAGEYQVIDSTTIELGVASSGGTYITATGMVIKPLPTCALMIVINTTFSIAYNN